jgi:uncharacterized protein (DUF58 family)
MGFTFVLADATALRLLYLMFSGLQCSRDLRPNPCIEGSPVHVRVTATSRGGMAGAVLSLDDYLPPELELEGSPKSVGTLRGYLQREYDLRTKRRGVHPVGPLRAIVSDAFGMGTSSFKVGQGSQVMVYPRHGPVEIFRGRESSEMLGLSTTEQKGASADFLSVRPYEPGDEVRTIHWRSSAKQGRLMVRELAKEEIRSTIVVLNCEANANRAIEEVFELGVRVAASVSVTALKSSMEVKLVLYGEDPHVVGMGRGTVQLHRILSALATVNAKGNTPMSFILNRLATEESGSGTVHVVSPTLEERDLEAMSYLTARGIAPAVVITQAPGAAGVDQDSIRRLRGLGIRVGFAGSREGREVISWTT